jgi:hypothetical protein
MQKTLRVKAAQDPSIDDDLLRSSACHLTRFWQI